MIWIIIALILIVLGIIWIKKTDASTVFFVCAGVVLLFTFTIGFVNHTDAENDAVYLQQEFDNIIELLIDFEEPISNWVIIDYNADVMVLRQKKGRFINKWMFPNNINNLKTIPIKLYKAYNK